MAGEKPLFEFLLRMGDSPLILGQRLSEWCGHGPALEEDIAVANIALDLIGQTRLWLDLAGEIEGRGRDADTLAYHRDVWNFRNLLLVEQPNGDFGQTMMRQVMFDTWHHAQLTALVGSSEMRIAEIAEKAVKEVAYHLERSSETVIALGDGSEESHARMQAALDLLWPYMGEAYQDDAVDEAMEAQGVAVLPSALRDDHHHTLITILQEATLTVPDDPFCHTGGRNGVQHSEHLGHILPTMQWLQRAYPGASW